MFSRTSGKDRKHSGFTLIEVAIILFVMGIFISFAANMMRNLGVAGQLRDEREKLTLAADMVNSQSFAKLSLPSQKAYSTSFYNDVWSTKHRYYNYSSTPYCGITTTGFMVRKCSDPLTCTNFTDTIDVAYILVSFGANFKAETKSFACPSGFTKCMYIYEPGANYDDITKIVTLADLKKVAGCNTYEAMVKIINNDDFPSISLASSPSLYNSGSYYFSAANGTPDRLGRYRWKFESGQLPTGLIFANKTNTHTFPSFTMGQYTTTSQLVLRGTATTSGTNNFTLSVTDSTNTKSASKTFTINVNP